MEHSVAERAAIRAMRTQSDLYRNSAKYKCGTDVFDERLRKRERDELVANYGLIQNLGALITQEKKKQRFTTR